VKWQQLTFPVVLIALLAGCAGTMKKEPAPKSWREQLVDLNALVRWQTRGKIAFRGLDRAESASVTWRQIENLIEVKLTGPLGLSPTTLSSDGEHIEVNHAQEVRHYNVSDTQAIYADTGIDLPLKALPYWLKGIPDPNARVVKQEFHQGRLQQLNQSGWTIRYERYQAFDRYLLPTKMTLNSTDTQVRLILRDWTTEGLQ